MLFLIVADCLLLLRIISCSILSLPIVVYHCVLFRIVSCCCALSPIDASGLLVLIIVAFLVFSVFDCCLLLRSVAAWCLLLRDALIVSCCS